MSGDFIRSIRHELGLSQSMFAELLQLGKRGAATISDWERGVKKISKFYALKINNLINKNLYGEHIAAILEKAKLDKDYNANETAWFNLASKIRWGTDDEKSDLAFWLDRFFGL